MNQQAAETLRDICGWLSGCDDAWEGISYSAFHQDVDITRAAITTQMQYLEATAARLKEVHAALDPVEPAALERILKRIEDE